ncbi:MAG TPA: DUF2171 domain-containing protein [Sphingomicrobium sp.]|nr:DUF2171 domain-containing protein [Sphingomicrobium sp.]
MAYDRYEGRRTWREPQSRQRREDSDRFESRSFGWDRDDDRQDRGFFERAGDEVASWFGDDDAERRRREDMRNRPEDENWRRPRAFSSDDDYGRQARFRDEGHRRPYTGRPTSRRFSGDEDRYRPMTGDYGRSSSREWDEDRRSSFTGMASTSGSQLHDPHYSEWRRRQISELDRDYDEYRRENQSRFESEFSNWRNTRQGKRQLLGTVREHMSVVGSDDEQVGTVDSVRGDRIILTKNDSEDGRHHAISCTQVDRVEVDRVILDQPAAEAKRRFLNEDRTSGFFRDDEDGDGPHILNRAFSGTYER